MIGRKHRQAKHAAIATAIVLEPEERQVLGEILRADIAYYLMILSSCETCDLTSDKICQHHSPFRAYQQLARKLGIYA